MSIDKSIFWIKILCTAVSMIFCSCNRSFDCASLGKRLRDIDTDVKSTADSVKLIKKLGRVIDKQPNCILALKTRGSYYMAISDFEKARQDFLRAYKLDSLDIFSLYNLGVLYNVGKKNDIAIKFLVSALSASSKNNYVIEYSPEFSGYFDIKTDLIIHFAGIVYYEQGDFLLAKKCFLNDIDNSLIYDDTYGYLAAVYTRLNRPDSACYFHNKSIKYGEINIIDKNLYNICK